jgi:alpha-L-fucosidase
MDPVSGQDFCGGLPGFAKNFTAAKYDPQAWAQLASDAGVRYVVITTKHHDGFALFDSAYSDWNAVKASGAKRDLIRPLAEAVRAKGLKFGVYYSLDEPGRRQGARNRVGRGAEGRF